MKKPRLKSGLVKLFEEASFLGFAIVLISSSIVLASTINSRNGAAQTGTGPQGRVVLDNNIALTIEIIGRNTEAKTDSGEPVLYNGEKTDLRIYYRADGGAITAGSRAVITLPGVGSFSRAFFAQPDNNFYPQSVNILSSGGDDIGGAVITAEGAVEITFSRTIAEGDGGVFTIDGQNIFVMEDTAYDDALIELTAGNPGSAEAAVPIVAHAHLLANSDGIGLARGDGGGGEAIGWINTEAYENGKPITLGVTYHASKFGLSDGDLLQITLPSAKAEGIGFTPITNILNVTSNGALIGTASFPEANGDTQDVNIVFSPAIDVQTSYLSLSFYCEYSINYAGNDAQYGVPVIVLGCDALVLTMPSK